MFNALSSLKLIRRSSFESQFVNCFPPAQVTKFASEGIYPGFETPCKRRKKSETEYQSPKRTNVPQYKKAIGVVSHLNVLPLKSPRIAKRLNQSKFGPFSSLPL